MEWVRPEEVESEYGSAVNPRKETTRGLTVHEFVQLAHEHGGELRVGWYPSRPVAIENGGAEVPREDAVNLRLNALRVTTTDLGDVDSLMSELPPGAVTDYDGDALEILYRID